MSRRKRTACTERGECPWCLGNYQVQSNRAEEAANDAIREFFASVREPEPEPNE